MTELEKQIKIKEVLSRMCRYGDGCSECDFFNPDDETDEKFWCAIRDSEKRIPFDDRWDMASGMTGSSHDYKQIEMIAINEQIKELRATARGCEITYGGKNKPVYIAVNGINSSFLKELLNKAADTIESLFAKLQAINCDGEWIYCGDKDNLPTVSGEYQTVSNNQEVFVKLNFDDSDTT